MPAEWCGGMIGADEALRIDIVELSPMVALGGPPRKLDRRLDELSERGIDVIAISAETREGSEQLHAD